MTAGHIIAGGVFVIAAGAWLVAAWSAFQAWVISERHEPYRALGLSRFVNWMGAIKYMPAEAKPHLVRFYKAVGVFFIAVIAGIATSIVSARS
ncbi:MAG: hypothetical protein LCH88_13940 [Proteobacteria bacterium]|nr:hypothetical protein [Pseudomonadota bacterium]